MEAAAEVFAEQGFEAAATKEIARRAGCSESMLFHYFVDKQGIFEQVVSPQIAEAVAESEDKVMRLCRTRFSSNSLSSFSRRDSPAATALCRVGT